MSVNIYEPPPTPNEHPPCWQMVIKDVFACGCPESLADDMDARDQFGRAKYNVQLQPFNGRSAIKDAYQESLDLAVYLKQAQMEHHLKDETCIPLTQLYLGHLKTVIALHKMVVRGGIEPPTTPL